MGSLQELLHNQARMKKRPTKAERQFKKEVMLVLKDRYNINFKFQKIVYEENGYKDFKGYILDFYLPEFKLCIEIDGKSHNNKFQQQYDEVRSSLLAKKGIKTIRFTNEEVKCPDQCLKNLYQNIEKRKVELKTRRVRAFKVKFVGSKTQKALNVDRDQELTMQAKFIAEHGITVLPEIRQNRRF